MFEIRAITAALEALVITQLFCCYCHCNGPYNVWWKLRGPLLC